jgi:hypothetical protein
MTDMPPHDNPSGGKASLLDGVTIFAAVLGSLIALGQAASTWIDGIYQAAAEREKTEREVRLADIKERSALAESYLQLILNKETPIDGRAILFSALGELDGHPLRHWARQRYQLYVQYNTDLERAYKAQSEAAQHAHEADGLVTRVPVKPEGQGRIPVAKGDHVQGLMSAVMRIASERAMAGVRLPVRSKNSNAPFPRVYGPATTHSTSCIPPGDAPYSLAREATEAEVAKTHGLEAIAGVYHGVGRSRAAAAQ